MWRHLLTKLASYKVPLVMVSTHGSVVPLAMFEILGALFQGWVGIPVSRDSREYKPQISRPFPSRGILNFPFPFPGKGSFGRELGREKLSLFAVLNIF